MAKSIQELVRQANRRIDRIKSIGMQPVTLKSPADSIRIYIEEKGTSREGQFKTWAQIRLEHSDITIEKYEKDIKDFLLSSYGEQTTVRGSFNYYRESVINHLQESNYFEDIDVERLYRLPKQEFIELINNAHQAGAEAKDKGGSSDSFYYYIYDYLDNME